MNLVITFDYELFGDGSGNIFNHMINPTNEILEICDEFNVKTTIFFEVIEYLVIKKEWDSGNFMGYKKNPIKAIEDQLISAAISGHDIQLHIHPQWTNARYIDGNWLVDFSRWRLSDFKSIGNYTIDSLLRVGKQTIENLLKPYISDYECTILRAGAYNILPSSEIHRAMVKAGLKFDSSVYPGGFQKGELSKYNYTNTSVNLDYWNVNPNDFSIEGNSNIIEIPIFALPKRRIRKLNCNRFRSFFNNINSGYKNIKSKSVKNNIADKISYWFEREALTWDFCLFDYWLHKSFLKYIDDKLKNRRSSFVLIGHPKGFTNSKSFKKMLSVTIKNYNFITLKNLSESISC